jgi:hypothetical protein
MTFIYDFLYLTCFLIFSLLFFLPGTKIPLPVWTSDFVYYHVWSLVVHLPAIFSLFIHSFDYLSANNVECLPPLSIPSRRAC